MGAGLGAFRLTCYLLLKDENSSARMVPRVADGPDRRPRTGPAGSATRWRTRDESDQCAAAAT